MLHAGALGGAGVVASAAWPREHPRGRPRKDGVTTFVFVAGASGGVGGIGDLSLRGHRTVGVALPGHDPNLQYHRAYQAPQDLAALAAAPSPMKGIGLDDYTEAAVATVRRAAEHGPVVVVGGSMGGATLSRTGNEVPHLIDRLVYMSAFCCVDLPSVADYLTTPEGGTSLVLDPRLTRGSVGDPAALGATRMNWRSADPDFLAAVKAANLAPDGTDGELMALLNGLLPDESATVALEDARGHKDTWGRIPRTFIRHTLDRTIPLALQNRMIREAYRLTPRNRFDVRDVRTGHFPTGAAWSRLMDILDGLAVR
jgi:pimeloyl-ACP methyl ester carboxylesterase